MSKIQWTEQTWNPVRGCSRVSEGCRNCYAERMAARDLPGMNSPTTGEPFAIMTPSGPRWTGKVELIPRMLDLPLRRKKPTTYFANSMSDLFHEALPDEAIDRVFAVMALCPQHKFQVLTKRAERMEKYCSARFGHIADEIIRLRRSRGDTGVVVPVPSLPPGRVWWPLPWVYLGVSVEDQPTTDERIPYLLKTPAALRFVSYEPALGPVDFGRFLQPYCTPGKGADAPPWLDWLIIGGESGHGARPFDIAWVRNTIAQCAAAGVKCFVKQLGSKPIYRKWCDGNPGHSVSIRFGPLKDRKGGDPAEWPEDIRVREMPEVGR